MASFTRREVLGAIAAIGAWNVLPSAAQDNYPSKTVRIVLPYPPGGGGDTIGRLVAQGMMEQAGQTFLIDNRPGAAGNIGTQAVARSAPDGYTLLHVSPYFATNPFLFQVAPFDPVRDFMPVALYTLGANILVANPELPVTDLQSLIALARSRPGGLSYGSSGLGTTSHLAMEMVKHLAKIDLVHIPYKGGAPMVADLLGGRLAVAFDNVVSALPYVQSGKLRPLAISSSRRASALADVPTVAESGLPGFEVTVWQGLVAPAGTNGEVVARLNGIVRQALQSSELRKKLLLPGVEISDMTPQQFAQFIDAEISRWGTVIKQAGIKAE